MNFELKNYRTDHGVKTVLIGETGRKYFQMLMMDHSGLVVKKVPLSEQRYLSDVIQNGKSKSIKTITRQYREFGKRTGMTKAAKSFLSQLSKAV